MFYENQNVYIQYTINKYLGILYTYYYYYPNSKISLITYLLSNIDGHYNIYYFIIINIKV